MPSVRHAPAPSAFRCLLKRSRNMTLISWLRARRQGYGSWRSKNIQWLIVSALNLQAVPFWSIVLKVLVFRLRHGHGAVDSEKVCGNLRRGPASLKSTPRPLSQNLQLQFVDATIHTTQHNRHTHTRARVRARTRTPSGCWLTMAYTDRLMLGAQCPAPRRS